MQYENEKENKTKIFGNLKTLLNDVLKDVRANVLGLIMTSLFSVSAFLPPGDHCIHKQKHENLVFNYKYVFVLKGFYYIHDNNNKIKVCKRVLESANC